MVEMSPSSKTQTRAKLGVAVVPALVVPLPEDVPLVLVHFSLVKRTRWLSLSRPWRWFFAVLFVWGEKPACHGAGSHMKNRQLHACVSVFHDDECQRRLNGVWFACDLFSITMNYNG